MKILLIHSADIHTVKKANKWRKKREGLGEIYQLSFVGSIQECIQHLKRQIEKAKKIYNVERIVLIGDEITIDDIEPITNIETSVVM